MVVDDDGSMSWGAAEEDEVCILGELIGGYQLSPEDHVHLKAKHLRPYCVVKFQNKTIHYSSPSTEAGRDPIWTVSTGSLFLLRVTPSTLSHDNLQITICTKKNVTSLRGKVLLDVDTYFLGRARVDGQTILSNCSEQRVELPLEDQHGNEIQDVESTLALRFRLATESDIRLIDLLRQQGISPPKLMLDGSFRASDSRSLTDNPVKDLILGEGNQLPIADVVTENNEAKLAGDFLMDTISSAFRASTTYDSETRLRKVRVKPGPDPTRIEETKFLSPFDISKETRDPSQRWVEAGSGQIGTLHLEILSCHDLPNVDVGETVGNLTDAFVVAVFEDVMLQTPVIDDDLNPHWLPWTQRAFRVGIVHPASVLYLGVFDYDFASEHEAIGRVAVNLTNFQSNTLYTLKYKLHPTSDLTERTPNGTITIRLRIEYEDEKAAILAALQPSPVFHVNTRNVKTFKVLRYTCFGEYDCEEKFAWPVTRSYIGEVLEYWGALKFYMKQSFWSLVFWRGQVQILSMNLPIHSAVLFISGAVLIERPWLIVPFYCLFVAWFLLATMAHRRETPSPWHTCTSFLHYAEVLLTGNSRTFEKIRPAEYLKQTEEYEKSVEEWKERYQSSLDSQAAMEEKLLSIGNENISTEVSGQMMPLDLLERLGRYQGIAGRMCTRIRRIKSIIIWEDSMTSFWITAKYLTFGLISLVLPWRLILYFVAKAIVWGFLGPQMKLVDMYLQSRRSQQKESELEDFKKQTRLARIRREEALKLKDMKCLAFGEYVTLVPSENLPRHYDHPLHESRARYVAPSSTLEKIPATSRIPGQQLYGMMIPHTKSALDAYQEGVRNREIRLASLEEQVKRLQSIEEHLSSKPVSAGLDQDLPDHLGYEVTLNDEMLASGEEKNDTEPISPKSLSLSPTGFRAGYSNSEKCLVVYPNSPKSQFFADTASRLAKDRLIEEEEKEDDAASSKEQQIDQGADHCSCKQCPAPEEGSEVDQDEEYLTPLLDYPNSTEENKYHQSFVEQGIEVDNTSYLTPPVHHDPSQEQISESIPSPDKHHLVAPTKSSYLTPTSDSAHERGSIPFSSQDNSQPDANDGVGAYMTPQPEGDSEAKKTTASFTSWFTGSHEEEEKKEQDLPISNEELAFMTPSCEREEGKNEQHAPPSFLELDLHDREEVSVKDEGPMTSSRRQLLGPRQKAAAISVRSIGSGSVVCAADQALEPKQGDESIHARSIGSGSLKSGSDVGLVIQECTSGSQQQQRLVVETQLNLEGLDESEQSKLGKSKGLKLMASVILNTPETGDGEMKHSKASNQKKQNNLEINTSRDFEGSGEAELPTPKINPNRKAEPAFEDCIEAEPSESRANDDDNHGDDDNDDNNREAKQGSYAELSWLEETRNSIMAAATDVTSNTTSYSVIASETEITTMTNNVPTGRGGSNSLRKTWSSGSLQREKTWIKECPTDSVLELSTRRSLVVKEEGLEVVAMGRLRTIGDEIYEDYSGSRESTGSENSNDHHGLSAPYRSSSYVQVAHYRP